MKKQIQKVLLVLLCFNNNLIQAQNILEERGFLSPELSVGYTFGARFNIGIGLDFGVCNKDNKDIRYGGSITYNLIRVKNKFHKQTSLNLMWQTSVSDIKIGFGRIKNGWGYKNKRACIVRGYTSDISFNYPNPLSPKIGYRNFIYRKRSWAWFEKYYHSVYLGYEYYDH